MKREVERRTFLKGGMATLGLGVLGAAGEGLSAPQNQARVKRYVPLGQTGMQISDISFGSSQTTDPAVVRHAFEQGVNYFDTASTYKGGRSEKAIGRALKGERDKVFLATKVSCEADTTRQELMTSLEGSLQRLQTDHVDVYFNHAVNHLSRLQNPEWYEFVRLAKAQGKIRFTGMSGHSGRLVECLDHVIANKAVDVVLVSYNFGHEQSFLGKLARDLDLIAVQPDLPVTLARAHEAGIGVIAMKTLRGARRHDISPFERPGLTYPQAAFGWVLSNPDVDSLIVSMTSSPMVDEYLAASGSPIPRGAQIKLLEQYLLTERNDYCNHGCEICHASCPNGVEINEVLRTRMYATGYRNLEYAREDYAKLGAGASACTTCTTQNCLGQCPGELAIADLTRSAHRMLS